MSSDLGDVVRLTTTVRDADGTPANAGSMSLTITLPDDSTVTVGPIAPTTTGVYDHAYQTVQAGRHTVRWVATGTNATADADVFNVRLASVPMLFSLREAKNQLDIPLTSTGDDEELRDYIESVTSGVEYYVGPIVRRTVQQVLSGGCAAWVLHTTPVMAVSAVTAVLASQPAIEVGVLDIDGETGIVRRTDGVWLYSGEYRVTYTAGRAIAPPSAILAAKMILQHLWRTKFGAARGVTSADDFLTTEPVPGFGYAIPNRALQLLQSDREFGGFA